VEKKWWENCVVEQNIREDISNQILDLYEQTGGSTISTIASRF
jgi:trehalose-6-phosphatase